MIEIFKWISDFERKVEDNYQNEENLHRSKKREVLRDAEVEEWEMFSMLEKISRYCLF